MLAERELAEERAARAFLEAALGAWERATRAYNEQDESLFGADYEAVVAAEANLRALAGASTPAPVPEDGTGGAE